MHNWQASKNVQGVEVKPIASSLPFLVFMAFIVSLYLRVPARISIIASFRPNLILAMLVILTLIPYLLQRKELLRLPTTKALNFLILWIVISLPFVEWPGSVFRENWFSFVKVVLLFYFTIFIVDTPNRLRWFVSIFLSLQVFRVIEPLYLHLTTGFMGSATHLGGGEFADRLSGAPADVINPNGLGFVIATTTVFAYFMLWQSERKFLKLIYLGLLPMMLYALVLSMSRGGFIALLVGGVLIFRQSQNKFLLIAIAATIAVGTWSIMSDVQRERYTSLVKSDTRQSYTVEGRFRGMSDEFKLGLNRPIFGHGLGTTPEAKFNIAGGQVRGAHNLYAELLIEIGIVGMILFLTFLWRVYGVVRNNLQINRLRGDREGNSEYFTRLNRALFVVFWMYVVFSVNYFGLSQDYWYIFCGICVVFGFITQHEVQEKLDARARLARPQQISK